MRLEVIDLENDEVLQNLLTELRRGTLVLVVLSQLTEPQYGYSLLQKLENLNIFIEANTLYPLMRRLEKQGLLESDWDTTESRPKKYYSLSCKGKEIYDLLKQEWIKINENMLSILKEEK